MNEIFRDDVVPVILAALVPNVVDSLVVCHAAAVVDGLEVNASVRVLACSVFCDVRRSQQSPLPMMWKMGSIGCSELGLPVGDPSHGSARRTQTATHGFDPMRILACQWVGAAAFDYESARDEEAADSTANSTQHGLLTKL
eukprot:6885386-Prymnesium_polylepis.1